MQNDEDWPEVLEEKKTKIKSISQAVTALDALGIILLLDWEPSAAQVTHSYSAVYLHLNNFTAKLNFAIKVDPLNIES